VLSVRDMLKAPNLSALHWLDHGFGQRDSVYPTGIVTVRQIHSDIVIQAGSPICEGDALVSAEATVGVRTADCVPVLLADPVTRSFAAVHAGWRGTAANIVERAVQELLTRYGARPQDIVAAVGPSIGPCCYEVGPEVAGRFGAAGEEHVYLDLPGVNEGQLRAAGVENIWTAGVCTFCEAGDFYSYRREKEQAGRMLSWIGPQTRRADTTG
jgi:YfiH family protein